MANSSPPIPLYALLLLLAVLAGGAFLATRPSGAPASPPSQAPADAGKVRPFSDMPPEAPPPRRGGASEPAAKILATAPTDLETDPRWVEAQALAAEGEALFKSVIEARERSDREQVNTLGRRAKEQFDAALDLTGGFEEEITAKYGDGEPTVRRVVRTRSGWFQRLDWLLKGTAR